MIDLFLGGINYCCNLDLLYDVLQENAINPHLLETPNYYEKLSAKSRQRVISCNQIPTNVENFIPLDEFWVTAAIRHIYRIGREFTIGPSLNLLKISRSKLLLANLLTQTGYPSPICEVASFWQQAKMFKNCILKPDSGYSGYGVRVIENKQQFAEGIAAITALSQSSMASIMGVDKCVPIVEKLIEGKEYSVDLFCHQGFTQIIRLCQKQIRWYNRQPYVIGYRTIENKKITQTLKDITNTIYTKNDTAYGQLDFVIDNADNLICIDFSPRIGGGMIELERFCEQLGEAQRKVLLSIVNRQYIAEQVEGFCQYNVLPDKNGILKNIKIDWERKLSPTNSRIFQYKNVGDEIDITSIGSAGSRIMEILEKNISEEDFIKTCDNLNQYVQTKIE
ncbi:hypothetical protein FACS1894189_8890 [Planctomycetales bacterium]|nr:hypothetical protein FACS1894189_8890 [Planctomycetales bacterium]